MLTMLFFTLLPGKSVPSLLMEINDLLLHAGMYFINYVLLYYGWMMYKNLPKLSVYLELGFAFVCIALGGMLELIQEFAVHNRAGEWSDFVANSTGCVLAISTMRLLVKKQILRPTS